MFEISEFYIYSAATVHVVLCSVALCICTVLLYSGAVQCCCAVLLCSGASLEASCDLRPKGRPESGVSC